MLCTVADENYNDPRLAAIYDVLDPDRSDLQVYLDITRELGARSVLDIGCGTGVFALLLAEAGFDVVGLEPAVASLTVARAKPGSEHVRWIAGGADALPPLEMDLVTMTANVAQAISGDHEWSTTLDGAHDALVPGGHLVFETRIPAVRAWEGWHGLSTTTDVEGVGQVIELLEVTEVTLPFVRFQSSYRFVADGSTIISESTLRYRDRDEISSDLARHGFKTVDVRDAPDRPDREWVFVARRAD